MLSRRTFLRAGAVTGAALSLRCLGACTGAGTQATSGDSGTGVSTDQGSASSPDRGAEEVYFECWQAKDKGDLATPSEITSVLIDSGTFPLSGLRADNEQLTLIQTPLTRSYETCDLLEEMGYRSASVGDYDDTLVTATCYDDSKDHRYDMLFNVEALSSTDDSANVVFIGFALRTNLPGSSAGSSAWLGNVQAFPMPRDGEAVDVGEYGIRHLTVLPTPDELRAIADDLIVSNFPPDGE
ncbi:twin-arginine translocation signal domain-containing protein [Thermophilibacter sp.]